VSTVHVFSGGQLRGGGDGDVSLAGADGLDGGLVILGHDTLDLHAELLREVICQRLRGGHQVIDLLVWDEREGELLIGALGRIGTVIGVGRAGGEGEGQGKCGGGKSGETAHNECLSVRVG